MAFQDFDQISERRKLERQQKMKKRIIIAVVLVVLLLVAVAAAVVYTVVFKNKSEDSATNKSNKNASTPPPNEPTTHESASTPPPKANASPPPSPPSKEDAALPSDESEASPQPKEDGAAAPPPKEDGAATPQAENAAPPSPPPNGTGTPAPSPQEGDNAAAPAPSPQAEGTIGALCAATDFSKSCGDILSKVLQANASVAQPSDLLKATVSAAIDEIANGIDELGKINKDIPKKTVAYDDCMALLADAKKDLNASIYILDGGIKDAVTTTAELNNKLSAALTYQGMCMDGYPEADQSTVQSAFVGDGSQKSIITGSKNIVDDLYYIILKGEVYSSFPPLFCAVISGDGFFAYKVGFRNTAGPEKLQAVALRVQADHAVFMNCRMVGYQSVIYAQTYRQFYRGCYITGTVDIISGNAAVVFQNCKFYLRKPMDNQKNVITAQGRLHKRQTTGTVLQSCSIFPDNKLEHVVSHVNYAQQMMQYLEAPLMEFEQSNYVIKVSNYVIEESNYVNKISEWISTPKLLRSELPEPIENIAVHPSQKADI